MSLGLGRLSDVIFSAQMHGLIVLLNRDSLAGSLLRRALKVEMGNSLRAESMLRSPHIHPPESRKFLDLIASFLADRGLGIAIRDVDLVTHSGFGGGFSQLQLQRWYPPGKRVALTKTEHAIKTACLFEQPMMRNLIRRNDDGTWLVRPWSMLMNSVFDGFRDKQLLRSWLVSVWPIVSTQEFDCCQFEFSEPRVEIVSALNDAYDRNRVTLMDSIKSHSSGFGVGSDGVFVVGDGSFSAGNESNSSRMAAASIRFRSGSLDSFSLDWSARFVGPANSTYPEIMPLLAAMCRVPLSSPLSCYVDSQAAIALAISTQYDESVSRAMKRTGCLTLAVMRHFNKMRKGKGDSPRYIWSKSHAEGELQGLKFADEKAKLAAAELKPLRPDPLPPDGMNACVVFQQDLISGSEEVPIDGNFKSVLHSIHGFRELELLRCSFTGGILKNCEGLDIELIFLPFNVDSMPLWTSYTGSRCAIWSQRLLFDHLPLMKRQHRWFRDHYLSDQCPNCVLQGRGVVEDLHHFLTCPSGLVQRRMVAESAILPVLRLIVGDGDARKWQKGIRLFDLENPLRSAAVDGSSVFWRYSGLRSIGYSECTSNVS